MPDTGAPWNIPYVAGTDLVRDWPTDSQDVAEAVADALDVINDGGIGTNVVSALKTDAFSTTSSSPTAVTGLSVTITPSSATSKILVIGFVHVGAAAAAAANSDVTLLRDSSAIAVSTAGAIFNATAGPRIVAATGNLFSATISVLDSPATTSAVQYDIGLSSAASTAYINRAGATAQNGYVSSITAIEVAA